MPAKAHDPRLTPARPDLADARLKGQVEAERYVPGRPAMVIAPKTVLQRRPDDTISPDTELLCGERVKVFEVHEGWAWVQSALDGYVGYVPAQNLSQRLVEVTHQVATLSAQIYTVPKLKVPPVGRLPFSARVAVLETRGGYARIGHERWIPAPQLALLGAGGPDWVAIAERFLGVPYIWGGRSAWGLDCSALVQLSRQAVGAPCPRDSDMQAAELGTTLAEDAPLARGDLIFWKGHVGIMQDARMLLHANAHHMAVAVEPLDVAMRRIESAGDGAVIRRCRLDGPPGAP